MLIAIGRVISILLIWSSLWADVTASTVNASWDNFQGISISSEWSTKVDVVDGAATIEPVTPMNWRDRHLVALRWLNSFLS